MENKGWVPGADGANVAKLVAKVLALLLVEIGGERPLLFRAPITVAAIVFDNAVYYGLVCGSL